MAENHRNHENDELGRLDASDAKDRKILLTVLLINLTQSAAGIALGIWAGSTALMGAGLDNLADASVYAVSLYAVGRAATVKVGAARLSGFLLIGLAALLLLEVLRRFAGRGRACRPSHDGHGRAERGFEPSVPQTTAPPSRGRCELQGVSDLYQQRLHRQWCDCAVRGAGDGVRVEHPGSGAGRHRGRNRSEWGAGNPARSIGNSSP
ncbi:Co/Zn/Cd efflux system protein [Pseudomonas aeruginosa]|nr:Co/Zn/Cd efflux system protein [Pseudomonas aeruginosa]